LKKVYFDAFFGLINKSVYFGLRILIIFLFSKSSTTNEFASFVYILNIVEITRLLLDFGIDSTYTRHLARMNTDEAKTSVENIYSQKLLMSLAGSIVITMFCFFAGLSNNLLLLSSTAFILPFISVNSFINIFFQSKNKNKTVSVYYIAAFFVSAIIIYFLYPHVPLYVVYLIIEAVFFLTLTFAIFSKTKFRFKLVNISTVITTYKTTLYNGSSQAVVTIYSKTDLLFIQKLSSAVNVAYYGFFMRIMDPLLMIASSLGTSAYSFFSQEIDSKDELRVKGRLRQYLLVTFIYACAIMGAITFLMPFILDVLKSKFSISISLAFLFGLATAVRIISAAQVSILLSAGRFNYIFKISLINICTLFSFYFILIPHYNLEGVLAAIIFSEVISVSIKAKNLIPLLF
jgi:O-antigen/teichoic acid export membrane protein